MSHPEQIVIGPLVFRVSSDEADYLRAAAGNEGHLWGQINYGTGLIMLAPSQSESHRRMTLLHEALHAMWHLSDRAHENDEDAVRKLAAPLLDMLRRNPDLVAYLTSDA